MKVIKSASITSRARENINDNFAELYAGGVGAIDIDAGESGVAGSVDIFPATAAHGKLAITVADQTGNTTVALTAAAMGQATTVTIPDPGAAAGYVVMTTAALALAEADVLQNVTPGTGAASKAMILDANSDWSAPVNCVFKYFQLKDADDTLLSTTLEYVNSNCDPVAQAVSPGAGFSGAGTVHKYGARRTGGVVKTEIMIDLTDTKSVATDLDIIGVSGVSHIGRITAALNGTILYGKMTCLEVPVGGAVDLDLYAADEGTGAYDGLVTDLTADVALVTAGGNWTLNLEKFMTGLPAANQYLYLTSGTATAGTYSAGKFLIEFWGY